MTIQIALQLNVEPISIAAVIIIVVKMCNSGCTAKVGREFSKRLEENHINRFHEEKCIDISNRRDIIRGQ